MNRQYSQPQIHVRLDPIVEMERKPMYRDGFKHEQINHMFMKSSIEQENNDIFKSYVHGLEMNKIKEIPLSHHQAYDMPQDFRADPYLVVAKMYEENKNNSRARFHKDHIFGNQLHYNTELPIQSRKYA